jgi:HAD superfamily hydrolase (TIGR01509 family)
MDGMTIDAVLFDFDGVLVDSEPVHFACWREILSPFDIRLDWETYNRVGRGFAEDEMVHAFSQLRNPPVSFEVLWAKYPQKKQMFVKRALRKGLVSDALRELLESLTGFGLAVVTSSSRPEVEPVLQAGGVLNIFRAFISAEDVANRKPAPDPYLKAARELGVRSPLVVEDSDVGEASGRAAGFEVLRIPDPRQTPELVKRRIFDN